MRCKKSVCHLDQQSDTSGSSSTEQTGTDNLDGTRVRAVVGTVGTVGTIGAVRGVGSGNSRGSSQSDNNSLELHYVIRCVDKEISLAREGGHWYLYPCALSPAPCARIVISFWRTTFMERRAMQSSIFILLRIIVYSVALGVFVWPFLSLCCCLAP